MGRCFWVATMGDWRMGVWRGVMRRGVFGCVVDCLPYPAHLSAPVPLTLALSPEGRGESSAVRSSFYLRGLSEKECFDV